MDRHHGCGFSFESVVDELIFIVGPVLVTILATTVSPAAGIGAAMLFVGTGTLLFAVQRRTEPEPSGRPRGEGGSAIAVPASSARAGFSRARRDLRLVDVATVAFADEQGPSCSGTRTRGVRDRQHGVRTRVRRDALAVVAAAPLPRRRADPGAVVDAARPIPSIPLLVPFAFLVGLSISPTIVAAWLVESLVPARQLTEGLTWATTGVGFGIAIGSSLAGRVVEAAGAHAGYAVTLCAGVATAIIVIAGWRWLRPPKPRTAPCLSTMSPPPPDSRRLPSSSPRGDCPLDELGT